MESGLSNTLAESILTDLARVVFLLEPDGGLIWANQAGLDAVGYTWTELKKNWLRRTVTNGQADLLHQNLLLAGQGHRSNFKLSLRKKDGGLIRLEFCLHSTRKKEGIFFLLGGETLFEDWPPEPLGSRDSGPDPKLYQDAVESLKGAVDELEQRLRDRTADLGSATADLRRESVERRQVQEALMVSEERFRVLTDLLPTGAIEYDSQLNLTYINSAGMDILALNQEEFNAGVNMSEFVQPAQRSQFKRRIKLLKSGRRPGWGEYHIRKKDGGQAYVMVNSAPVIKDNRFKGGRLSLTDITELKMKEIALKESEALLKRIIDLLPHPIYVKDRAGKFILANLAAAQSMNMPLEQITGRMDKDSFHESQDRSYFRDVELEALRTQKKQLLPEVPFIHHTGKPLIYQTTLIPFWNQQINDHVVLGISVDITELKITEKLLRIQRDLGMALTGTTSRDKALDYFLKAACLVDGVHGGGIYLINEKGQYELVHTQGLSQDFIKAVLFVDPGTTWAKIIEKPQANFNPAEIKTPDSKRLLDKEGATTVAIIPLKQEGRNIGSMNLASNSKSKLPRHSQAALEAMASQLGTIVARIDATQGLAQSQGNLQTLFETIDDFLFILASDGQVVHYNPIASDRLGYSDRVMTRQSIQDFHQPNQKTWSTAALDKAASGDPTAYEAVFITKSKEEIPVETRFIKGRWSDHDVIFGLSRDITARVIADEALKQKEEELKKQAHDLAEANIALKVLLDHRQQEKIDLKNNVMATLKRLVMPYIQKIKRSDLSPEQQVYLGILESNLNYISAPFARQMSLVDVGLTKSEMEIVELIRRGKSSKDIADLLDISANTISFHRKNIRTKLGIANRKINLRSHLTGFSLS